LYPWRSNSTCLGHQWLDVTGEPVQS